MDIRDTNKDFVDTVLPPIPTKDLTATDVDKLTLDTREKMLNVLEEFAKDPGSKAVLKASAKKVL